VPNYLLDTGFFVTARLGPYGFDIAPGFWETLDEHIGNGTISCPDEVYQELIRGQDNDLTQWIRDRKGSGLFLPVPNAQVQAHYVDVSNHVKQCYEDSAASKFLAGADGWLVAHALDCGATVVTCEVMSPPGKGKVKIPDVCVHFKVPYMSLYRLVRVLRFRLTK
jgi:hypothetical protein